MTTTTAPSARSNRVPDYDGPAAASRALIELGERYMVPNYSPQPVVLARGDNARVWDHDGNDYIDLGTGISVTNLGHSNPALNAALAEQGPKLLHASNLYYSEPSLRLAEELVADAPFARRAFFCNSGAEANEAAIKLARKHASVKFPENPHKREIITFHGGFHGRTIATVTATAQPKYQQGFEPLPGGFHYAPYNDLAAVEALMGDNTCAVLIEPIQGEGGINPAADGFLTGLRELCDRHGALLMCDEIQTGMGRTGKLFTHQWEPGLQPDVVSMAKALGGGLPIGGILVGDKAAEILQPGSHGTTFGGNALACAVARTVWAEVRKPELLANVTRQGEVLTAALKALNDELDLFTEIRGRGLMLGAQLNADWAGRAGELINRCRRHGTLVLMAGAADVLRFLPPLTITDAEMSEAIDRFSFALRAALDENTSA